MWIIVHRFGVDILSFIEQPRFSASKENVATMRGSAIYIHLILYIISP